MHRKLNISKTKRAFLNVKKNTFYHCRFESIDTGKGKYIFDVSHNPDAIRTALDTAGRLPIDVIVFGLMKDKDYKTALKHLSEKNIPLIFSQPGYFRARNSKTLYRYFRTLSPTRKKSIFKETVLKNALERANLIRKKGYILVLGSFFLASEAIKILKAQKYFS
jgi:folylpolyglutamate synthase/dihydropteroate synthase